MSGGAIDYSPIVDAVDFGNMGVVVLSVAGALAGIYVLIKGVRTALSFIRGDGWSPYHPEGWDPLEDADEAFRDYVPQRGYEYRDDDDAPF